MAFRIKEYLRKNRYFIVTSLILTLVIMFPYITRRFTPVEHDTFFHLSRIEQLSKSIRNGQFLPAHYPEENFGFGYASPLFYSDFFLIPPALLHLCGLPLGLCYRLTVIIAAYISCRTMMNLVMRISGKKEAALISGAAYLFSNYHIADIYIRGALGEVFALAVLPAVLDGLYQILIEGREDGWFTLALSIGSLALCHNLTFALGSLLTAFLSVVFVKRLNRKTFYALFKGVGFAFLITAFYTLPMIEQLKSQTLIVDYFASGSDLSAYSIDLWQYFANKTVFATAGNWKEAGDTMLVNVGYFLQFVPLLYFFFAKEKNRFVTVCLITGYVMILLPSSFVPWDYLTPLRILQFPWRLNTIGIVLLSIPAGIVCADLLRNKVLIYGLVLILSAECVWHVYPARSRTFGLADSQSWQDVLDGKLCDPCYSADYVRVELAAGDYLPWPHPDYREQSREILDENGNEARIPYTRTYLYMSFKAEEIPTDDLILPLTWYKGWAVYKTDGTMKQMPLRRSDNGLVQLIMAEPGSYIVLFEDTPLRRMTMSLSMISFVFMILTKKDMNWLVNTYRRNRKKTA
ncbi:MAG: hypothetical protein IJM63_03575 [Solobacterium sp.]|nr:hypothetical protein [Solobacterium sp.]